MKNVMKTATLESKFPLLAVENGCIISKDADKMCIRDSLNILHKPSKIASKPFCSSFSCLDLYELITNIG